MKILCVAHQRGEVMAAVTSLRGLPPEASVAWASSFKDAARWIRDNEDLAVLVLDAQVGSELCASFLKHLRGVGVTAPAIVVTADGAADSVESLGFGPNDSVLTRGTLSHELPAALLCAAGRIGPPLANSTRAFLASPKEVARSRDALEKRLQEAAVAVSAACRCSAASSAKAASCSRFSSASRERGDSPGLATKARVESARGGPMRPIAHSRAAGSSCDSVRLVRTRSFGPNPSDSTESAAPSAVTTMAGAVTPTPRRCFTNEAQSSLPTWRLRRGHLVARA